MMNHEDAINSRCDDDIVCDQGARRPMNAFLIFCKRHRNIVRDHYPNLENRAITKILGDWWAMLRVDEKLPFTELAKDFKDAFFQANPTFKWYKQPAVSARPIAGYTRSTSESDGRERLSSFSSSASLPVMPAASNTDNSNVGVFKFADEAQMGGLSSLMTNPKHENNNDRYHANNNMDVYGGKEPIEELQRVLNETQSFFQNNVKSSEDDSDMFSYDIPQSDDIDSIDDDGSNCPKKSRACKGKRYAAFMNQQHQPQRPSLPFINRSKIRTTSASSSSSSSSLSPTQSMNSIQKPFTFDHLYANDMVLPQVPAIEDKSFDPPADIHKSNVVPNDFDLEQKIQALDAQKLEEYLVRKQTNKRKKGRSSLKKKHHKLTMKKSTGAAKTKALEAMVVPVLAPKTMVTPPPSPPMVGSQKRKPRKKSISRIDLLTASIQDITAPFAAMNTFEPRFGGSGLLMLAEVAAANCTM